MIKIIRTFDGQANLHIWRTGESYKRQKGEIFQKEWTNIYFSPLPQPEGEEIAYHDIRQGLPFDDNSFDAVYALRTIEHLTAKEGKTFAGELYRILKPQGICRLTTPDLEDIAREYVKQLDICSNYPTKDNVIRYQWITLELLDQMVREKSGGLMLEALREGCCDPAYARQRYQDVFDEFNPKRVKKSYEPPAAKNFGERLKSLTSKIFVKGKGAKIRNKIYLCRKDEVLKRLGGDPRKTLEAIKWFYDRLSLRLMLEEIGFVDVSLKSFKTSDIPHWERYNFDQSNFGDHPIEPSLYVEAKKKGPADLPL